MKPAAVLLCLTVFSLAASWRPATSDKPWQETFDEADSDLLPTGKNPYFSLDPGYTLILEGKEDGKPFRLTIKALNETKKVGAVETRIVEEREEVGGVPVEVSRNFFACSRKTQNVYYFGEEVDEYRNGKVVSHGGAWLAGEKGARYGLMMPASPVVGQRHYQEMAPKVAMDRAEVVSVDEAYATPAGEFKHVLRVEETTPLEPGEKEYKYYAPGVGLLRDGGARLIKYGKL